MVAGVDFGDAQFAQDVRDGVARIETLMSDELGRADALMAEADVAAGEKQWAKCRSCHALDGSDGVGPHLNGVVGREVASVAGFNYSGAMTDHAAEVPVWDVEAIQAFIENPRGVVSGTAMSFGGLKKPEDRANVIAYIQENS